VVVLCRNFGLRYLRAFSAADNGATRALTFDPANARVAVPAPGVVIVTLPAR